MRSLLVVDDNPLLTFALVAALGDDFMIESADNAAAALELMRNGFLPQVLFSDIVMPGALDGLGLAKLVQVEFPEVRILLTTGWKLPEYRGFEVMLKPYEVQDVRDWIDGTIMQTAKAS